MALSIDEANAVSRKWYDKNMYQQVYDDDPFLAILKGKNKIAVSGGTQIQWGVRTSQLNQANFVGPRQQVSLNSAETRTAAVLDWGYLVANTTIHWDERVKNDGPEAIVNLLGDKAKELAEDWKEKLSDVIWGTDTTHISPLAQIVDSSTSYGGIATSDAASWASTEDSSTTVLTLFGSGSLTYMRNQATFGKNMPTHHFTTRDLVSKYESLLQPQQRYESDQKTVDMGFMNVLFYGRPVVGSPFVPAGDWYGLDMDAIELVVKKGEDDKVTPWFDLKQVGFPNAMGKYMSSALNLKCDRRKTSFKFTALDYTS